MENENLYKWKQKIKPLTLDFIIRIGSTPTFLYRFVRTSPTQHTMFIYAPFTYTDFSYEL